MTITTDKKELSVILQRGEQIWALRAKVRVPKSSIKSLRFEEKFQDWRRWEVRMPGARAPRLLLAGSFWTEEGWDFLYIKRPRGLRKPRVENVLVIETDQDRYRRVIVTCDQAEAQKIIKWFKKK